MSEKEGNKKTMHCIINFALSVMINGSVNEIMPEVYNNDDEDTDMNFDLESVTEAEGLRYFGSYIDRKFPQYQMEFKL